MLHNIETQNEKLVVLVVLQIVYKTYLDMGIFQKKNQTTFSLIKTQLPIRFDV